MKKQNLWLNPSVCKGDIVKDKSKIDKLRNIDIKGEVEKRIKKQKVKKKKHKYYFVSYSYHYDNLTGAGNFYYQQDSPFFNTREAAEAICIIQKIKGVVVNFYKEITKKHFDYIQADYKTRLPSG